MIRFAHENQPRCDRLFSRVVVSLSLTILFLFLPSALLYAGYDARAAFDENLARPEIEKLLTIGRFFLSAAFIVTIAIQIFHLVLGTERVASLFATVAKFTMLFVLYSYGGPFMTWVSEAIIEDSLASHENIAATYATFDRSLAVLTMGPQENVPPQNGSSSEGAPGTDVASSLTRIFNPSFLWGFILAFLLKGLLLLSLAIKFLLIDITWPLVHQIVLLGFVFAVPFTTFAGWAPVKHFAMLIVEVSIWPLIYNLGLSVAARAAAGSFVRYETLVASTQDYDTLVGALYASLTDIAPIVGYFLFLVALGTLIPAIAAMTVRSESGAILGRAVSSGVSSLFSRPTFNSWRGGGEG